MIRNVPIMLFLWFLPVVCSAELSHDSLDARWRATVGELGELTVSRKFPFDDCLESASALHDVPKPLLLAVARGESDFDPDAVSDADAFGVMQIRWPLTANHLGIHKRIELFDACTNIDAGTRYLSELLQRYDGNVHRALAAYNYGPSKISQSGAAIPSGALWYSDYIHRQLVYVQGSVNNREWKTLVKSYSLGFRAQGYLAQLESAVPGARFEMSRGENGRFYVSLLHASSIEFLHGVHELRRIGFWPKL